MKSLVIVKPDAVRRGLVGEIIMHLCANGFLLVNAKLMPLTEHCAEELYEEHRGKDFFTRIVEFMSGSEPSMVMIWEGSPQDIRKVVLSIRAKYRDFASPAHANIIHASDSESSAAREVDLFLSCF